MNKLLLIYVKFAWFFLVTYTASTYKEIYGFMFLVFCAVMLIIGDGLLTNLFKK